MAECPRTELDESVCGCEQHRGRPAPLPPVEATAVAQFRGVCPIEGNRINEGDTILKIGEWGWCCDRHET